MRHRTPRPIPITSRPSGAARSLPGVPQTVVLVLALAAAACGGVSDDGVGAPPPQDPPAEAPGDDPTEGEPVEGDIEPILATEVDQAITALAEQTGVDRDSIEVLLAERVTWSDGSMGCPQPDMMYTQALVEGYRIVLSVSGDEVTFHGADGEPPFRCDDPTPPAG